jgi:aldose 1-epimerase
VLRSTAPAALDAARASGCFPLVPYANRLGYRRFRWKGVDHSTQPNFDDSPHSLHGVGWQRPWELLSSSALEVVLRYRHAPDAHWPFAFEARQYFTLTPQSMRVQMVFDNLAEIAQPMGLGWHPYFPKRARSRLHVEVDGRWDSDATQLPVRKVAQSGIDSDIVHLDYDNCFDGWRGAARIRDERLSLQLTSSLDRLVVYTPQLRDYFCVEPVSHVSNAIHMADPLAHGLRSVAPGESAGAWMQLDVSVL